MPTVLVTGGSGMIGSALSKLLLRKGYDVIILSRREKSHHDQTRKPTTSGHLSTASWDIGKQTIDEGAIGCADYIIHLSGAGVADKRWTTKRKAEITESRVKGGELIVKALKEIPNNIKAVISASAIGWYGADDLSPRGRPFTEEDPPDQSFLGETCRLWEQSINPVTAMGKRLVKLRTGIVLSNEGGALPSFEKPIRFGIAAILGTGKQVVSWIHIDDLCRMYADCLELPGLNGVYNAVAPNPVDNKTLTLELAKNLKGRFYIPAHVPVFLLKTILGEMSVEVLKSTTVSAEKIRDAGFRFLYPDIESAVKALTKK